MPPPPQAPPPPAARPPTTPLARAMARDLGVDLATIRGTGRGGRIRRADVEAAAAGAGAAAEASAQPAASRWGLVTTGEREERIPVKGVRKMTAQAMVASA
ncbi:MAG TPA: E3 binding domain-containing protein, partial [Actinomycetota bacterium]|nr:E3 binding domain-containing protein [Actinomycetota bacterium]